MPRRVFVLLIASTCLSMVTSLKQIKEHGSRKTIQNPYHPYDGKLSDLVGFSEEDSDYFVDRYGRLSGEATTIVDKMLKINGRHFNMRNPYVIVDRKEIK